MNHLILIFHSVVLCYLCFVFWDKVTSFGCSPDWLWTCFADKDDLEFQILFLYKLMVLVFSVLAIKPGGSFLLPTQPLYLFVSDYCIHLMFISYLDGNFLIVDAQSPKPYKSLRKKENYLLREVYAVLCCHIFSATQPASLALW